MTIAHGPQVAIILSFTRSLTGDGLLGAAFYPNACSRLETPVYNEGRYISMIDGLPLEPHEALGQRGTRGWAFEVENDTLKHTEVSFTAKPDANQWISTMQAGGLNMIHEPGYEMVLAALRKICEPPEASQ